MPYNEYGTWILPEGAEAWEDDDDLSIKDMEATLIASRDLLEGQKLVDLFGFSDEKENWERKQWETDLDRHERAQILLHYAEQGYYEGGDKELREGWGIEYERDWEGESLGNLGSDEWLDNSWDQFRVMLGPGYDIDFAHYNNNLAYRSTVKHLKFEDLRTPFTTGRQISEATRILKDPKYNWTESWVRNNAMAYSDDEVEAMGDFMKHNQTRHFDPETNITTYLNPKDSRGLNTKLYEAKAAGDYTQLKEPGSPQFINVIAGEVPKAEYTSEGTRIVTDNDIRLMYQRYLGRDYNSSEFGVGIHQDEIDYWQKEIDKEDWDYKTFEGKIASQPEAKTNIDKGKAYFNPNAGKEAEITDKLTAEPAPINPPDLTIRKVTVKQPDNIDSGWRVPMV